MARYLFLSYLHLQSLDISRSSDKILTAMTSVTATRRWANDDVGPIMHHGVKDPKDVTSFYYQECSFLLRWRRWWFMMYSLLLLLWWWSWRMTYMMDDVWWCMMMHDDATVLVATFNLLCQLLSLGFGSLWDQWDLCTALGGSTWRDRFAFGAVLPRVLPCRHFGSWKFLKGRSFPVFLHTNSARLWRIHCPGRPWVQTMRGGLYEDLLLWTTGGL